MREGDEETTYLLLFRHAHLILAHLAAHSDSKDPQIKSQLAQAKREVNKNLKLLDILKPRINQRYERYAQLIRERDARQSATFQDVGHSLSQESQTDSRQDNHQHLDGNLHSDLAVKLAQEVISRRADTRSGVQNTRRAQQGDSEDLSRSLQAIRAQVEPRATLSYSESRASHERNQHPTYNYPKVHGVNNQQLTFDQARNRTERRTGVPSAPPVIPPKPRRDEVSLPPRPDKVHQPTGDDLKVAEPKYTFASTASLENGTPLRTLFLPPTMRTTFLRLAYKNTLANLETCAFLAGTLISNALFVSKLIVPAQIATSDTCEMTNESQLFDYVDSQDDLMVLGWIHTHPSQTCFMSSQDLHTHAGYQMMLAESIAIVCAPSKGDTTHGGDWGAFRLTDPPGKMAILQCNKPGVFHPHDIDNSLVYTNALRPGHVVEANGLEFEVVDLR